MQSCQILNFSHEEHDPSIYSDLSDLLLESSEVCLLNYVFDFLLTSLVGSTLLRTACASITYLEIYLNILPQKENNSSSHPLRSSQEVL